MLAIANSAAYCPPEILVRWLSGRKQRFAKAPYPKRVPRVRIPPSPVAPWLLVKSNWWTLFPALPVTCHSERSREISGDGRAKRQRDCQQKAARSDVQARYEGLL